MRIVLDAMGSDTYPEPEVKAAVEAARRWGDKILLTGPEHILLPKLDEIGTTKDEVEVIHAPEVLEMTDKPAETARGKAMNSMAIGMDLVKEGEADAFVTAGNTGGAMANAIFRIGRIRGVKRPAVAVIIPVRGGKAVVIDVGANVDCKPTWLIHFAILGTIYAERMFKKRSPRVALLSNGEEAGKGNILVKDTYPMMEAMGVNFIGNIEPKEVYAGEADVVVTDAFAGNVFIKTSEAVARFMSDIIREEIKASPISSVGGLLAKSAFRRVKLMMDPSEVGAAPLLGINGNVLIAHGRSDSKALVSAIRIARQIVDSGLLQAMREAFQRRLEDVHKKEEA